MQSNKMPTAVIVGRNYGCEFQYEYGTSTYLKTVSDILYESATTSIAPMRFL